MKKELQHNKMKLGSFQSFFGGFFPWTCSLPHYGGRVGVRGCFFLLFSLFFFSCSKESVDDYADEHEVKFGVGFVDVWKEGNFSTNKAKAVTRGDLERLDPPAIPKLLNVFVEATEKADENVKMELTLTNKDGEGNLNSEGVSEFDITPKAITEENYMLYKYEARTLIPEDFSANTDYNNVWGDGTIPLFGNTDYLSGTGVTQENLRVYFKLNHNTVLVRFVLGVSSEIDVIRTIKLKSLNIYRSTGLGSDGKPVFDKTAPTVLASVESTAPDGDALTTAGHQYAEFHVNPNAAELFETVGEEKVEKEWLRTVLIVAQYDVYDKNGQITRSGCTAQNTLALGFTSKEKGKYYDIYVTVRPDFLYVLSDGDKEIADVVLK